ncbi:SOS response-associated peptidase family protein [Muricomes intestini]|uniref:SOS response-associated peptidase family protein n=1 Tax=Muricomes intestini TaxID=1796634 RepID=UPI002FE2B35C
MCGRYYVDRALKNRIKKIIKEADCRVGGELFDKDIYPTDFAPVIINGDRGPKLACQRWGYPGYQGKGVVFNARAESVMEKRMFYNGIRYNRTVIPAGGDMILMPQDFLAARQAVLDAVNNHTITEERLDESLHRIYRKKLGRMKK